MRDRTAIPTLSRVHSPAADQHTRPLRIITLLVAGLVTLVSGARAQELEPRTYTNTPVGLNFFGVGPFYSEGALVTDPALALEDAKLHVYGIAFGYVRSLGLWGKSAKIDVLAPYARASGSAIYEGEFRERDVSGWADPRFRFSVNFYGAPALSLKEFASYRQNTIVGASLQLSAPVGQYDTEKLLNIGTNRWSLKAELGASKALKALTLELAGAATFYTDNDEFLGAHTREQDPVYSVQGHILYNFRSGVWLGLDGTYYTGGRTTIDGVRGDDRLNNTRLGLTVSLPIDPRNSIKVLASSGVSTRTGTDFDTLGVVWQYRWGGGL